MRIVFTKKDVISGRIFKEIREFKDINIDYASESDNDNKLSSSELGVTLKSFADYDSVALFGVYDLDGTEETLDKALSYYNNAVKMLTEKGYCNANDFGNIRWVSDEYN